MKTIMDGLVNRPREAIAKAREVRARLLEIMVDLSSGKITPAEAAEAVEAANGGVKMTQAPVGLKLKGKLREKQVTSLLANGRPGRHGDGAGLYLVIASKTAAHWERRYASRHEAPRAPGRNPPDHYLGLGSSSVFGPHGGPAA